MRTGVRAGAGVGARAGVRVGAVRVRVSAAKYLGCKESLIFTIFPPIKVISLF